MIRWFIYFQGKLDEFMERVCLPVDTELKCNDTVSNGKVNFTIACNNVQCQQTFTIKEWTTSVLTNDSVKYSYTENCSMLIPQPAPVTTEAEQGATQLTQTTEATQLTNGRDATKCVTIIAGTGATMGLLTLLLAVMTVGWAWTCWVTKKRGEIIINSKQVR